MKKFKNIVLLAAGESTRFFPLSDKNVFQFLGKPLLLHQINTFSPYAERIFVVTRKPKELVFIKDVSLITQEGEGQAAAVLSAYPQVKGETLILNNCDLFDERIVLPQIVKLRNAHKLILAGKQMEEYFPGGYFQFEKNTITKIMEKPKPDDRPSRVVRLVIDYFADFEDFVTTLQKIPNPRRDDSYEEGLNHYLPAVSHDHIIYDDYWNFLKYPWHVLTLKDFFLKKIKTTHGKNVRIHPTAILEGEIYLADGVVVGEYAKIVGPCYIGQNSVVGTYALVRESMIGSDCMIGGYTEVTRSYLGNHVYLHRNYVGDSVFENNILCGSGMVCANFRFDGNVVTSMIRGEKMKTGFVKLGAFVGSDAKIGVNVSLMPGVKIAPHANVMPHSFINKDIP